MQRTPFSRRQFLRMLGGTVGMAALARGGLGFAQDVQPATGGNLSFQGNLDFWDWLLDPRAAFMGELIGNWQTANPGITVNYTTYDYADLQTRILAASSSQSAPPLANNHAYWRFPLQKAGALAPFPQDLFDFDQLISTPYNRDADGNIYTSTFGYYCDVVFYNGRLLEEAGYTPDDIPATWEDFMRFSRELTVRDEQGFVTRPGCALNHYYSQEWLWNSLIYQQGDYLFSEDGATANFNGEAGVAALQMIKDWFGPEGLDDPNLLRHADMFGSNQAAMFISHGYWASDMDTGYPDVAGVWGTRPIPTYSGTPEPSYGLIVPEEGLGVFNYYPDDVKEAAFDFIGYVLGPDEHRIRWAQVGTTPPDKLDLLNNPALTENDPGGAIASQGATLAYRINYGERPVEAEAIWRTMFEEVILAGEDAQAAADRAAEAMNAVLQTATDAGTPYLFTERNYTPPVAEG